MTEGSDERPPPPDDRAPRGPEADRRTGPSSSPASNAAGGTTEGGVDARRRAHMARSSLIVMAAFIGSKVVGLLRERAIAHEFGASASYDAYVAAFQIPDLLFTLIAGGALISAFLPVFSDALARGETDEAWDIASGMTNLVLLVTAGLSAAAALAGPWLVARIVAPGFDPAQQALTVDLMRIVLVSTVVFAVSGLQMGMLNAFQHFLLPAIAPITYNLGILVGALALAPRLGARGLAYGVVLGALLHLVVKVPGLVRYGFRYAPILGLDRPGVRQVLQLMWPRVLALLTVRVVFLVNTRLASGLEAGSLSALNYAWVISQMPQTVVGTAIATVAFPTLAELAALGRRDALRGTGVGALRVMIALAVPAAVGLLVLARPAVGVLLQTGQFDSAAATATAFALQMFALGLVGHVALEIVARLFYAQKDTITPMLMATAAMVLNVGLAVLWVGPLAQGGLALANSVAVSLEVVLGLWILGRRWDGVGGAELAGTLGRALLAGGVMAAAIAAALTLLPAPAALPGGALLAGLVQAGVGGLIGLAAYVAAAALLGLEEVRDVGRRLARRLDRRRGRPL